MTAYEAEAIAKIKCDIGIENVKICHIAFKGWAIIHTINDRLTEIIYTAKTKEECEALLEEVKNETMA